MLPLISFLCLSLTQALPLAFPDPSDLNTEKYFNKSTLTPIVIREFPLGTWLENLVIRHSDGNALVTSISAPEVYLISTDNSFDPILVAAFPENLACLGIVELGHDVFYVITGDWSPYTDFSTSGTYSLWEIDLHNAANPHSAKTTKIASLPHAGFLNGLTVLNPISGTLLLADSLYSAIWSVNIHSGAVRVAINDTATMSPTLDAPVPLGINSLHLLGNTLYYANTNRASFHRVSIDLDSGAPTGPITTLLQSDANSLTPDDFAIDFRGNVWLTNDPLGQLDVLPGAALPGATTTDFKVVAGTRGELLGPTAAQFGTKKEDLQRGSLYVVTNGGPALYPSRNWTTGGQLVRFDTAELGLY
ncbi:MAG: hypothetical protein Q9160_006939 [Pyrenula sp. 1 TL-2023]